MPEDIRMELRADGGVHLFVRKKPGISSVLLTETTRDPSFRADNYAYRAPEWNAVNGDEIRLLNGAPLTAESQRYSLIDSTPENHPELGEAFHIYIPWLLYYGYEDTRHGEVPVVDGTYMNIRSFVLPYADYRADFMDNPFVLRIIQREAAAPSGDYLKETEDSFKEIAAGGGGNLIYAKDPEDLIAHIKTVLENEKGNAVDLVLCMDTTGSMRPYIDEVRRMLIPTIEEIISEFSAFRIGMVLYKDYYDEYLTRPLPFTGDFSVFQRNLNAIQVRGGGDIPEAVYEALYDGLVKFNWENESRVMLLVGDAPSHPKPRGRITKEMVDNTAAGKNVKISAIILPKGRL